MANFPWHQASSYIPGMMATPSNPEMGQLMGLLAGQVMGPMFGPENFLPHLTAGGMGVMDQYAMRHFQQQQFASAQAIGTANNQNVAARLLALRTGFTNTPATEQNRNQAEYAANILNNPFVKGIAGQIVGQETLEAMMHGTKGDVAQLHSATMRMGYYMRDPSGAKRMDAQSMEDFSRGVYAHLYEEGGNFDALAQDAEFSEDADVRRKSRQRLKKAARVQDDIDVITDADFMARVKPDDLAMKEKISQVYEKHVQGNETDTIKQAEAIAKIQPAVKETGLLTEKEMLLSQVRKEADKMQVAEMHGLMAGQVGQLQEYMMQRGMLPQAIGAMKPADRVKLMAGPIDDDTLTRLAMTEAERDLFANNKDYREAGKPQQEQMVQARLGDYKKELSATSEAIQKYNAGDRSTDIEDIEKMGGFEAIAGNVDAQRTASALKKYSGAVDAVREIFGDNGNPNAPMPALLAALDHLTQGANFQMDAKDVESTLRQMQMTAKEAGIGFEQMAAMSSQMGAMGQMMGLSPVAVMQGQVNAMAMMKTMRDDGTFSRPRFGAMSQGEAQQFVAEKMIAGDASDNAKAMAAAASIYKTGQASFEGTEFAAAMDAYLGGNKTYDFGGETKNLFEIVGREGPSAITRMFTDAGGTQDELMTAFRSPLAQELLRSGAGMQTQKYEAMRDINNLGLGGFMTANIESFNKENAGSLLGQQNASSVGSAAGNTITEMLVETAEMSTDDQISFMSRELPAQLKESFKTQFNVDDATAEQMANEASEAIIGRVDPNADQKDQDKQRAEQKRKILRMRNQADSIIAGLSGGQLNLVKFANVFSGDKVDMAMEEAQENKRVASRRAETGLGYKSHPLARVSDYLLDAGMSGEKVSIQRAMSEFLNIVPNKELAQRYISGMEGGLDAANKRLEDITYTDKYLSDLAGKGTNAADAELLQLAEKAGLDPKAIKLEAAKTYNDRGEAAANAILNSNDAKAIEDAYLAASGNPTTGYGTDKLKEILSGDSDTAKTFRKQQAQNAFLRERAKESNTLSDANVSSTYARHFGEEARKAATAEGKTNEQLRSELLASNYGVQEGARMSKDSDVMTREQLADKISQSDQVIGRLRKDAAAAGATDKEVKFLTSFNAGAFGAADDEIRKDVVRNFIDAYDMSDVDTNDKLTADQSLDALLKNTDPDDKEAQKKLSDHVRNMVTAGNEKADEATIARAQQMAETLRVGTAIDPASMGIKQASDIGDINTKDATINASGSTIVINGAATVKSGGTPGTGAATAAAGSGQQESNRTWLQWLTGQEPTQAPASQAQAPTAAANAAASATPTTAAASGAVAAAQDAAPQQDKPLSPATPAPDNPKEKAAAAQAEQTYGETPPPEQKYVAQEKALAEARRAQTDKYADLSPAERAEANYYKDLKTRKAAQQTADDPTKSVEERSAARDTEQMLEEVEPLTQAAIVARRMAEDMGVDSNGDFSINTDNQPSIGGTLLDKKEFNKKLEDFKTGMENHGDPLSNKSRDYVATGLAVKEKEIELQTAQRQTIKEKAAAEQAAQTYGDAPVAQPDTIAAREKATAASATKTEKRYTADELAALHPEQVEDIYGDKQRWEPWASAELPEGAYKNVKTGTYVDPKTGEEYDRYGMPAGGTYSEDGKNWSVSGPSKSSNNRDPKEKAAAEQVEQTYGTPVPSTPVEQKNEVVPGSAADATQTDKQFVENFDKLQKKLASGSRTEQLDTASTLTNGRYVSPEMAAAAGINLAAAEEPASSALPSGGGTPGADVAQTSTNAARQANVVAASAEQTPRPAGGGASAPAGENKPMEVVGELSIVNLEKAVLAVHSKSGQVANAAGDMPVVVS